LHFARDGVPRDRSDRYSSAPIRVGSENARGKVESGAREAEWEAPELAHRRLSSPRFILHSDKDPEKHSRARLHAFSPRRRGAGVETRRSEARRGSGRASRLEKDSKGARRVHRRGLPVIIMTKARGKHPFNLLAYRQRRLRTTYHTPPTTPAMDRL